MVRDDHDDAENPGPVPGPDPASGKPLVLISTHLTSLHQLCRVSEEGLGRLLYSIGCACTLLDCGVDHMVMVQSIRLFYSTILYYDTDTDTDTDTTDTDNCIVRDARNSKISTAVLQGRINGI